MGAAKRRQSTLPLTPNLHPSLAGITLPARIARLPVDQRGFPVPKFVAWVNGQPDHRIIDTRRFAPCIHNRECWICGEPLGATVASVIGPMCSVNRIISEPPSHRDCAEFSLVACPFLSRPHAHRRGAGLPDDVRDPAGTFIKRNPGVMCLWISRGVKPFRAEGGGGVLFRLGDPIETVWYTEGRLATRAEVAASFYSGSGTLIKMAQSEGRASEDALAAKFASAMELLPAA